MQNRDLIAESAVEAQHGLIREGDLRDQNDCLLSLFQNPPDQFHIYPGLSASRDSMNQAGTPPVLPLFKNLPHSLLLLCGERRRFLLHRHACKGISPDLAGTDLQNALLLQRADGIARNLMLSCGFSIRNLLPLLQKQQQAKTRLLIPAAV